MIFITYAVCVLIFMTSPPGVAVCFIYKDVYLQLFLNVCPFEYTAVAGSGPVNRLTTPVGWMYLFQLTVLCRSAISV